MSNPLVLNILVTETLRSPDAPADGYEFNITLIANNRDHEPDCGAAALTAVRNRINEALNGYHESLTTPEQRQSYIDDVCDMNVNTDVMTTENPARVTFGVMNADALRTLIGV